MLVDISSDDSSSYIGLTSLVHLKLGSPSRGIPLIVPPHRDDMVRMSEMCCGLTDTPDLACRNIPRTRHGHLSRS